MATGLNTAEGVLVRIQDKLKIAMCINTQTLRLLIDRYISSIKGKSHSKTHSDKVNAYNEMTNSKMTIKVFFKLMRILEIKKISFTITVTTNRNKEVTVKEDVNISAMDNKGEDND